LIEDSFYFGIPIEWTRSGAIWLRAPLDMNNQINDSNRANNARSSDTHRLGVQIEPP